MLDRSQCVLQHRHTQPGLLYRIGNSRKESVRSIIRARQWFVNEKFRWFVESRPQSLQQHERIRNVFRSDDGHAGSPPNEVRACHPREGGWPLSIQRIKWVPAFVGMTGARRNARTTYT